MGLGAIGDMGGGGLNESTASSVTWETATDWDNAVSEDAGIVHDSFGDLPGTGVLTLGYKAEDETGQSALLAYYPMDEDSGNLVDATGNFPNFNREGATTSAGSGPWGRDVQRFDGTDDEFSLTSTQKPSGSETFTFTYWVYLDSYEGNTKYLVYAAGQEGSAGNANNLRTVSNAEGWYHYFWADDLTFSTTVPDVTWLFVAVTFDGSTQKIYYNGSTATRTPSSVNVQGNEWQIGGRNDEEGSEQFDGSIAQARLYSVALSNTELDALYNGATSSTLTTATKTPGSSTPDLSNLVYSLNGGSISVDVIGSPGTASEEVVTQSLGGASSYTLSWSSNHSDFRIRPTLSVSSVADTAPTLSSVTLTP